MKLFASILSLYILMLTTIPCIDAPDVNSAEKGNSAQNLPSDESADNHHCSPFCTCQCCATPVVFVNNVMQFSTFSYTHNPVSEYSSSYVSSLFISIWQPPKVM